MFRGTHESRLVRGRRSFLRALGAGAVALPFYRLLENSAVYAQSAATPMRYISVLHLHAAASPLFVRREGETETNFDIAYDGCVLKCFDDPATYGVSFKDKLIAIEGVDLAVALATGMGGHSAGPGVFTGATPLKPENSSIDQFLAVEHGLGASTRLTSIALGVGYDTPDWGIVFAKGGALLQKIIDPSQTWDRLFAGIVVGDDPMVLAEAARKRRLGASLLDYIRTDIKRTYDRVGPEEREKLDVHLTSLRELEKRLSDLEIHCAGQFEAPRAFAHTSDEDGAGPDLHEITQLQMGFLAQALACDLTRFGSVELHDLSMGAALGAGIADVPDDNHAYLAHKYYPPVYDGKQLVDPGDPASWERLAVVHRYNYGTVASFMKQLHDASVLQDTLIYMSGDMGEPNAHDSTDTPMLLLGGAGGKFRMGRRLKMKPNCASNARLCDGQQQFVPQNQVLVSIANAFGVAVDSYGTAPDPKLTQGPLSALTELGVSL
ncbi:MAG TPA: DUF1552 domain-containing protein [Polyangiaceae bacterium]|nr:DUF1552 domain-containing protein [Polyangiaceae bacterium]